MNERRVAECGPCYEGREQGDVNDWSHEGGQERLSIGREGNLSLKDPGEEQTIQVQEPADAKAIGREGALHVQGPAMSPLWQTLWRRV